MLCIGAHPDLAGRQDSYGQWAGSIHRPAERLGQSRPPPLPAPQPSPYSQTLPPEPAAILRSALRPLPFISTLYTFAWPNTGIGRLRPAPKQAARLDQAAALPCFQHEACVDGVRPGDAQRGREAPLRVAALLSPHQRRHLRCIVMSVLSTQALA